MATLTPAILFAWRPAAHPPSHPLDLSPFSRANTSGLKAFPSTSDSTHRILAAVPWRHQLQLQQQNWGRRRCQRVVVKAGLASTNALIFAFVFPLSLIIGTILVSIRIADSLDEKYLEELAMNKAMMEEQEAEEEDLDGENNREDEEKNTDLNIEVEENPVMEVAASTPRRRNRPRRRM